MQNRADLLLTNVSLPGGRHVDITIAEGVVIHAGAPCSADRNVDCTGMIVIPAAMDLHVHMRGGIQQKKEDWESGSRSAIAGGVTVVVDQPNTVPPLTTPAAVVNRVADACVHSWCHFAINGGAGPGVPLSTLWKSGVLAFGELFAAPSSYGEVLDTRVLRETLATIGSLGGLATIHAEEVQPGRSSSLAEHNDVRPPEGEERAVQAVIRENLTGTPLHFCHLSTARAVMAAGNASVEVTPHHLLLSLDQFIPEDTCARVNPPLRTEQERRKLLACWDRIDVIASDHAPHSREDKNVSFEEAPSGIPGVETMIPLLMAEVLHRRCSLPSLIEKTSLRPAALTGIPPAGYKPGDRADFALYPRRCTRIDPDMLHSRAGFSPFSGHEAVFPSVVIMAGRVVYADGQFFRGEPHWFRGKGYNTSHMMDDSTDTAQP